MLCLVMILALSVNAFAENTEPEVSLMSTTSGFDLDFYGVSGVRYQVLFSEDYVGYNNYTQGNVVKVCQAYCKGIDCDPDGIDGIWGNKSDTALRAAQGKMNNMGYSLQVDGVCGIATWRAFYGYTGSSNQSPPASIRSYL